MAIYDYHADYARVSRSMLNDFATCPTLYHGLYVAQTIHHKEPTKEMRLGTLLHLLCEHNGDQSHIAVMPKFDGRKTSDKEAKALWLEANQLPIADIEELTCACRMWDAICASPAAMDLIDAATEREVPLFFESHGLACRCKPDLLLPYDIVDIKSTGDPQPAFFERHAANMGYHRQAAFYLDGTARETFWIVAVRREQPYDVVVYRMAQDLVQAGREENERLLYELADCYAFDSWEPRYQEPIVLEMPHWMRRRNGLSTFSFANDQAGG